MLEDEDLVAHDHTHERDDTHDRRQAQHTVHQGQADEAAGQHQPEGGDAEGADAEALEIEQQEEENDDHRDGYAAEDLRQGLGVVFRLAAHLGADALGQRELMQHDVGDAALHGGGIDPLRKLGRHGQTALATAVHDAPLAPLRRHPRHLAQRHGRVACRELRTER